jgi:hypothetical protein
VARSPRLRWTGNLFGAPRDGYLHQGQDILTAEGTPVVAPLAGAILTTSYREAGAGYCAVEETESAAGRRRAGTRSTRCRIWKRGNRAHMEATSPRRRASR